MNNILREFIAFNPTFPKYTQAQIEFVLTSYKNYKPTQEFEETPLPKMLFVSIISGSEKARKCFVESKDNLDLNTIGLETHGRLTKLLNWRDKQSPNSK